MEQSKSYWYKMLKVVTKFQLPQIQIDGDKMKLVFLKIEKNWVVFLNS